MGDFGGFGGGGGSTIQDMMRQLLGSYTQQQMGSGFGNMFGSGYGSAGNGWAFNQSTSQEGRATPAPPAPPPAPARPTEIDVIRTLQSSVKGNGDGTATVSAQSPESRAMLSDMAKLLDTTDPRNGTSWQSKLKDGSTLSAEEYKQFKTATDRLDGRSPSTPVNNANLDGILSSDGYTFDTSRDKDLNALADYMDANRDRYGLAHSSSSQNWRDELVTRSENNNSLCDAERSAVTRAIADMKAEQRLNRQNDGTAAITMDLMKGRLGEIQEQNYERKWGIPIQNAPTYS